MEDIDIPKFCPILGVELKDDRDHSDLVPTLDRVIPELGYVRGNVYVISNKANRIKSNGTVEEVEKVLKWMKIKKFAGQQ